MSDEQKALDFMNDQIDVLFDQIQSLTGHEKDAAIFGIESWELAKVNEFLGLCPMQASHLYRSAFYGFQGMGLEVSGMYRPWGDQ